MTDLKDCWDHVLLTVAQKLVDAELRIGLGNLLQSHRHLILIKHSVQYSLLTAPTIDHSAINKNRSYPPIFSEKVSVIDRNARTGRASDSSNFIRRSNHPLYSRELVHGSTMCLTVHDWIVIFEVLPALLPL